MNNLSQLYNISLCENEKSEINIQNNEILDWNSYFMQIAHVIKLKSKDPKRKVGSILVSIKNNRIISTGFNGLPPKSYDFIDWNNRDLIKKIVIHAEMNCILFSNILERNVQDLVLYVTVSPCKDCIKIIASAGIKTVIYDEEYKDIKEVLDICMFFNIKLEKNK